MINKAKEKMVMDLTERLKDAKAIVLLDYKGINIEDVNELRSRMRDNNVDYFVSKNTLIKRALNNLGVTELDDALQGPTSVAISKFDEVTPAREIAKFIKEVMSDKTFPSFKYGYVDGKVFDAASLGQLAKLPSRDELIAKLLGSLNAPISGFVYTLKGVVNKFVYAIDAIAKEKSRN
ncbi:MAG: 50S ribosomal protein L10 [Candidatus Cloacimonas sp.]